MIKEVREYIEIDTITLSTSLRYYDYDVIDSQFTTSKIGEHIILFHNDRGFRYTYYPFFNTLHIRLSPSKLMGEPLTITNYSKFEKLYNKRIYELFTYIYTLDEQKLNRIDYKIDYHTEHIGLYLKLLKKTTREYRGLKRNREYKSSLYLSSKSRNINIYDKKQEYIDKCKRYNKPIDESLLKEYDNILRYEVQIKKPKIYNNLRSWGLIEYLSNYVDDYDIRYFIDDVLSPVIFQGDYYNQYWSEQLLKEYYTDLMVSQLVEFQKQISILGIDGARKTVSEYQFSKYLKLLQEVDINPVPIPKSDNITYLFNPINKIMLAG